MHCNRRKELDSFRTRTKAKVTRLLKKLMERQDRLLPVLWVQSVTELISLLHLTVTCQVILFHGWSLNGECWEAMTSLLLALLSSTITSCSCRVKCLIVVFWLFGACCNNRIVHATNTEWKVVSRFFFIRICKQFMNQVKVATSVSGSSS